MCNVYTTVEKQIIQICVEITDVKEIARDTCLFDLDIDSLVATRIWASVRERFEVDVPLNVIFESPSIKELSQLVERLVDDREEYKA